MFTLDKVEGNKFKVYWEEKQLHTHPPVFHVCQEHMRCHLADKRQLFWIRG